MKKLFWRLYTGKSTYRLGWGWQAFSCGCFALTFGKRFIEYGHPSCVCGGCGEHSCICPEESA